MTGPSRPLPPSFYRRPTLLVAEQLLGCTLARETGEGIVRGVITETEAYDGFDDLASHASRGRTPRNAPMFGPGGVWYVYFVYGMHWMLNVVTGPPDYPAAVLLRGVEGIAGPGRLAKAFGVDKAFDGLPAARVSGLWIEERAARVPGRRVVRTPRIGVAYAGSWADAPYRFVLSHVEDRAHRS